MRRLRLMMRRIARLRLIVGRRPAGAVRLAVRAIVDTMRGSTRGSRRRNLYSVLATVLVLICLADLVVADAGVASIGFAAYFLAAMSVWFFGHVCVAVMFMASVRIAINPVRLARNTLISIVFMTLSFALIYKLNGAMYDGASTVLNSREAVYFSAVTFSTLGYGDFQPSGNIRLFAALQAILGNLHLGLIVGAVYLLVRPRNGISD